MGGPLREFWSRVDKTQPPARPDLGPCWLWTDNKFNTGYGQLMVEGRVIGAHRRAWILTHGPIKEGLCVLHKCDVRACCNPDHLFLGTKGDNIRDCAAKGRTAKGERNGAPRGEKSPVAKLTWAIVRHIRQLRDAGHGDLHISRLLKIPRSTIYTVTKNIGWRD